MENGNRILLDVKWENQRTLRGKSSTLPWSNNSTISMSVNQLLLDWRQFLIVYVRDTKLGFPYAFTEESYIPEIMINEVYTEEF